MSSHSHSQSHYWPAFVDALTNVVINLLFLMGLMALAFFVVSVKFEESKSQQNKLAKDAETLNAKTQSLARAKAKAEAAARAAQVKAKAASSAAPSWGVFETIDIGQQAQRPTQDSQARVLNVGTEGNARRGQIQFSEHQLAPELPPKLLTAWTQGQAASAWQWRLRISTEGGNSASRRSGYLRLMAVRNALLDLGARNESIDLQIEENGRAGKDDRRVDIWAIANKP